MCIYKLLLKLRSYNRYFNCPFLYYFIYLVTHYKGSDLIRSTILIVEDDSDILEVLSLYVENAGYDTLQATTVATAWQLLIDKQPDLILLDVNLPDDNGFNLAKRIRNVSEAIIMFITANTSIDDKLAGFTLGGDDYITKPFMPKEVIARINAHLTRKPSQTKKNIRHIGSLSIHDDEKNVYKNGQFVDLFAKEKLLLFYLIENAPKVVSQEQIIKHVWGYDDVTDMKTVSVHMSTLRKKIEDDPSKPQFIQTIRGFGYRFHI